MSKQIKLLLKSYKVFIDNLQEAIHKQQAVINEVAGKLMGQVVLAEAPTAAVDVQALNAGLAERDKIEKHRALILEDLAAVSEEVSARYKKVVECLLE